MNEVDAICAALAETLPQRHPQLFGGILGVAYLNFSAYAVDDITRQYIVKVRAMPSPAEELAAYGDWRSWCSAADKEIWIHQLCYNSAVAFALGLGSLAESQRASTYTNQYRRGDP